MYVRVEMMIVWVGWFNPTRPALSCFWLSIWLVLFAFSGLSGLSWMELMVMLLRLPIPLVSNGFASTTEVRVSSVVVEGCSLVRVYRVKPEHGNCLSLPSHWLWLTRIKENMHVRLAQVCGFWR